MRVCHCSLAGTEACNHCSSGTLGTMATDYVPLFDWRDDIIKALRAENARLREALEKAARDFISANGARPKWWTDNLDLYQGNAALDAASPESREPEREVKSCATCKHSDYYCGHPDVTGNCTTEKSEMWEPKDSDKPAARDPEPGDIVLYRNSPSSFWKVWEYSASGSGIADYIVIMRASEVEARIREAEE